MKNFSGKLVSTWPVITEASHMLSFSTQVQINLLEWIHRGGLNLTSIEQKELIRLMELCQKYDDVPMDLADASLMVAAEKTPHKRDSKY